MMNLVLPNEFGKGTPFAGAFHLKELYANPFTWNNRQDQDNTLPKDLPDYLVYMTRKSLYAATTSLSKVSAKVHEFFVQLNAMLAFERMVRSFWAWSAAATAPWSYGMNQPWIETAPREQYAFPFWVTARPALPKRIIDQKSPFDQITTVTKAQLPIFASAISASMAFMTFAPMMIQSWTVAQ